MGRPPKPRIVDGVELAQHLHRDAKGRTGYWRYQRPDGSWKGFRAETAEEANRLAAEANAARDRLPVSAQGGLDRAAIATKHTMTQSGLGG